MKPITDIHQKLNHVLSELSLTNNDLILQINSIFSDLNELRIVHNLSEDEYSELIADKINLINIDNMLQTDEKLRHAQQVLDKLPGLITKIMFS